MGPTYLKHLEVASLLFLLVHLIHLKGVLGFWINSTRSSQTDIPSTFDNNQDIYAIFRDSFTGHGKKAPSIIISSIKTSSDKINLNHNSWQQPVILANVNDYSRQRVNAGRHFDELESENPRLSTTEVYRELFISLSSSEKDKYWQYNKYETLAGHPPVEDSNKDSLREDILHLHKVAKSSKDEDSQYNEFSSEVGNNANAIGDAVEEIFEKASSSPAASHRLTVTLPKEELSGTKRFIYKRHTTAEDEDEFEGLYRDMCRSRTSYELVKVAVNVALQTVEVLPNTWVWVTRCIRNNSRCPGVARGVVAKCKQKKTWVRVYARLHALDPWRAHWIVVDGSCNCGILDIMHNGRLN